MGPLRLKLHIICRASWVPPPPPLIPSAHRLAQLTTWSNYYNLALWLAQDSRQTKRVQKVHAPFRTDLSGTVVERKKQRWGQSLSSDINKYLGWTAPQKFPPFRLMFKIESIIYLQLQMRNYEPKHVFFYNRGDHIVVTTIKDPPHTVFESYCAFQLQFDRTSIFQL